jgi:hypothetical protein
LRTIYSLFLLAAARTHSFLTSSAKSKKVRYSHDGICQSIRSGILFGCRLFLTKKMRQKRIIAGCPNSPDKEPAASSVLANFTTPTIISGNPEYPYVGESFSQVFILLYTVSYVRPNKNIFILQILELGIRAYCELFARWPGRYGHELKYFMNMLLKVYQERSVNDSTQMLPLQDMAKLSSTMDVLLSALDHPRQKHK